MMVKLEIEVAAIIVCMYVNVLTRIFCDIILGCEQNTVSTKSRNWDKFVRDVTEMEKNEKPEGDAALNHLFQQIYADGSDDVKRAMVKSFVSYFLQFYYITHFTAIGIAKITCKHSKYYKMRIVHCFIFVFGWSIVNYYCEEESKGWA